MAGYLEIDGRKREMRMSLKNKLYSSASNDYILGLVNLILSNGGISEEVLKRIGRVLGAKWRSEYVSNR